MQVRKDTPPTLLIHAEDDSIVNPKTASYTTTLYKKTIFPQNLHILKNGGHGFGITSQISTTIMVRAGKKLVDQRGIIAH